MEIIRFINSFHNMFLFSNHNVTHMNVSKQYKGNCGVRAFLTIRKHQINLPPSSNFLPKIVPFTGTVPFTYFMGYSESILCCVPNRINVRVSNTLNGCPIVCNMASLGTSNSQLLGRTALTRYETCELSVVKLDGCLLRSNTTEPNR